MANGPRRWPGGRADVVTTLGNAFGRDGEDAGRPAAPAVVVPESGPEPVLRADTMHGLYSYLEENPARQPERFHELSHGEGFMEILRTRVSQPGFCLMDEPDALLSFVSSLSLVALLHALAAAGGQVIVTTHSAVVAAVPGARVLALGDWRLRPASWDQLELVASWRQFLAEPQSFLRHLLDQSPG